MRCYRLLPVWLLLALKPAVAYALPPAAEGLDLTHHPVGYFVAFVFASAYLVVVMEEVIELRKSKPMMLAAALIWVAIALVYKQQGLSEIAERAIRKVVLEYGELLLFLIVSIAYINALEERRVFEALRARLISLGLGFRSLFWVTGILAFFISAVANNMTTAMLMCAVVMAVGKDSPRFVSVCCVNTVVAVNAGGAFCPFGDITTLMVWQKDIVGFWHFFQLFVPSLVNFLVPACIMQFAIPRAKPRPVQDVVPTRRGAKRLILLFLLAILTAVGFENYLQLPAAVGMMAGLTYLQFFGYYLHLTHQDESPVLVDPIATEEPAPDEENSRFDVFHQFTRMEWDTLLFFYGIVLCVGGLDFVGYLTLASDYLYVDLGPSGANILVGLVSALIDNIPVMFAILSMNPAMSEGQWLLVTLTAGVGGSLLSVGSAAGVALMGQARGIYDFVAHLRWLPAILLGYLASIAVHFWWNAGLF